MIVLPVLLKKPDHRYPKPINLLKKPIMITSINHDSLNLLKTSIASIPASDQSCESYDESLVLIEIFRQKGVDITLKEAMCPVGIELRDYLQILVSVPRIADEWVDENGRACQESDLEDMLNRLYPYNFA
jgi:hypothetical protein